MKRPAATPAVPTLDRLISQPALLREHLPIDRTTLYRMVQRGQFPRPIRVGARRLAWRERDVQEWIDSKSGK